MAALMTCTAHGPFDGDQCPSPGCTELWRPRPATTAEPEQRCTAPGCDMPCPCPLHPQAGQQPQMRAHRAAREAPAAAPHGNTTAVRLRFPWGLVAVPSSGVLHVGRDFGDECGCQIAEFDNVSRRHATIRADGPAAVVVDQMSTNGTSVNGEPTAAYQERVLRNGDTLGFGAHLRVMVEITEDAGDHG